MPESYPLQYPLRKLFDEIYGLTWGSTSENLIDLGGAVYYYNDEEAVGIDGVTYGPVDTTHAGAPGSGLGWNHYLESNLYLKNGTIILFKPMDLTDEGGGLYSFQTDLNKNPEIQVHDPGEDNVTTKPRLALYPPQGPGHLTNFAFDENSWNNPTVKDLNDDKVVREIRSGLSGDGYYHLTGVFIGNTGDPNIYSQMISILDEIVADEPTMSTREEAALGMGVNYRGVQNHVYTTKIIEYNESSEGITLGYSSTTKSTSETGAYHSAFNWFGRKTFLNYGETAAAGRSVYVPSYTENKVYYSPARGSCTQLFASHEGGISGSDDYYWNTGFLFPNFSNHIEYDVDGFVSGFKHDVKFENLEFIGTMVSGGSRRGWIIGADQTNGLCNLELKGCTFHKGISSFSGGNCGLTIDNCSFLYPRISIGSANVLGGAYITRSKFMGTERSSAISTSNQDYSFLFRPKNITLFGNYFNIAESNHGQAISAYAGSYNNYKIIGNIFHNCQRSISVQSSGYTEWNWQNLGLSGPTGNYESVGDGFLYENNLIYHDDIPVQKMGGQAGWAFNGNAPTANYIFVIDDTFVFDGMERGEATNFVIQRRNPKDGVLSDKNYNQDLLDAGFATTAGAINTFSGSFSNFSNTYFDSNIVKAIGDANIVEIWPRVDGKIELYCTGSKFNTSNFWLEKLDNPDEQLYIKLYAGSTTFAEGLTLDSVKYTKIPQPTTVKRNTSIFSRPMGVSYDSGGVDAINNVTNSFRLNLAGSSDNLIIDAEGNDRQIGPRKSGFNGPFEYVGNVAWKVSSIGLSGGPDVDNLNYTGSNRRLIGDVIYQDNIIFETGAFNDGESAAYSSETTVVTDGITVGQALDNLYPNLSSGGTGSFIAGASYADSGILWTDDGTTSGSQTYPVLTNLKAIPTNWSDTHIPVRFDSNITLPPQPSRYNLVFTEPVTDVYMSRWDGTNWSVYRTSDASSGLTKEFLLQQGPGGLSGENDVFVLYDRNPGNSNTWRDYDGVPQGDPNEFIPGTFNIAIGENGNATATVQTRGVYDTVEFTESDNTDTLVITYSITHTGYPNTSEFIEQEDDDLYPYPQEDQEDDDS